MAFTCFSSPPHHHTLSQKLPLLPSTKPLRNKLHCGHVPVKKAPPTLAAVRSSCKNKVFENLSEGIICYRDDSGEIICEGFDEGPRFHHLLPRRTTAYEYDPSDAEIINLLQQRLLQIVNGGGDFSNATENGAVAVQEDCF